MLRRVFVLALIGAGWTLAATPTQAALPANSIANAVRIDAAGNLYLAGFYFATSDAAAPAHAFAAKLTGDASRILWWTQLAGSKDDRAEALALGADGSVYVTGGTQSPDFPTTPGAFGAAGGVTGSAFAARLDANGRPVYVTYLPVSGGQAIAVDAAGNAFVTGPLNATDALQTTTGAVQGAANRSGSGFIVQLDPTGSKLLLAIAGFGGRQIALDAGGNIYAAGAFQFPVAPATPGAFQESVASRTCASSQVFAQSCSYQHIAKIDPSGSRLLYATYLSGASGETPAGLLVDDAGNAIVAGTTNSPDYPTTPAAYQPEYCGSPFGQAQLFSFSAPASAGFVTKLNAGGSGLVWSTLFAGSGAQIAGSFRVGDSIVGLATDSEGNILIAGFANSTDLPGLWNTPVAARPSAVNGAAPPGFVARLSADGRTLSPVELLPGLKRDLSAGGAIAARADGSAVIAGGQIFSVSLSALGRVAAICDAADDAKIVTVAPGQLITLYGTNLDAGDGVAVTFNGIAAPLLYTSATQINLQVPYEVAGQAQAAMQVSSREGSPGFSESYMLGVAEREPGVFVWPASFTGPLADRAMCNGQGFAGLQPLAFNADGSMNTCTNPAAPGSMVTVFLNGVGVTAPAEATGMVIASTLPVSPSALLVPGSGPAAPLATLTVAGAISGVVQARIPAAATSMVVQLEVSSPTAPAYWVRGPGIVIWAGPNQ
ncbi:MAG TPA: IPT/TIG domain-containing protein [Candidatus Limnocylindrales bacterium]|nr:IPT/TIG domain-containing protein [Candidatus Limnocylindrales bacterium]